MCVSRMGVHELVFEFISRLRQLAHNTRERSRAQVKRSLPWRHTLQRASFKVAYYSCDYSGLPMRTGGTFLPHWKGNKMSKRGNFCCWEAALLHAADLADANDRRR